MPQRDYCGNYGAIVTEKMLLPPLIPDTKGSGARPYWSVMIPTYNARPDYLDENDSLAIRCGTLTRITIEPFGLFLGGNSSTNRMYD